MASAMPTSAQFNIECVYCKKNASHYCNNCGEAICETCQKRHAQTNHQIVLYKDRQNPKMVSEKCSVHPDMMYMMSCENCLVPVCTKCIKGDHRGHVFDDLYEDFITKHDQCQELVNKLKREILPQSQALLSDIKQDFGTCKTTFDGIKSSMESTADQMKEFIDNILKEESAEVEKMKKEAELSIKGQEQVINNHIGYLDKIVSRYEEIKNLRRPSEFILFHKENNIQNLSSIPEVPHINFPSFSNKKIEIPFIRDHFRVIADTNSNPAVRALKQNIFDNVTKSSPDSKEFHTLEMLTEIKIKGVVRTRHISRQGSKMWISDNRGNLVLSNFKGQVLDVVNLDIYADDGLHTATSSGDLLIVNEMENSVIERSTDEKVKVVIHTKDWSPKSVFCSPLTGHILVNFYFPR